MKRYVRAHPVQSVFLFSDAQLLNHSSQPRRKEESHGSQYAHQHKHPEEYPVNDHGHILPVLLHLAERRHSTEGHFKFQSTPPSVFYQLSVFTLD